MVQKELNMNKLLHKLLYAVTTLGVRALSVYLFSDVYGTWSLVVMTNVLCFGFMLIKRDTVFTLYTNLFSSTFAEGAKRRVKPSRLPTCILPANIFVSLGIFT